MNTGTVRIVIIVALLVTGGLLLANGFADPVTAAAGPTTDDGASPTPSSPASPDVTDTPTPPTPPPPDPQAPKETSITVYNGTDSLGLAGIVLDDLRRDGYAVGQEAKDALQKPVEETVVYYVGGADAEQNEVNAAALAEKYYPDAKVKELDPAYRGVVEKDVQVLVMLGVNDVPDSG